jgi:hypothetical protein
VVLRDEGLEQIESEADLTRELNEGNIQSPVNQP